jgi:hypothetical protein
MTFGILDATKVRRREKSSNPLTRSLVSLAPPTLLLNTRISIDVLGIELLFSRAERVGMAGIIRKRNLTQVKVRLLKLRKTKGLLLRTKMKRVGAPILGRSGGRPAASFPKLISHVEFRKIQLRYIEPVLSLSRRDKGAFLVWNLPYLKMHASITKLFERDGARLQLQRLGTAEHFRHANCRTRELMRDLGRIDGNLVEAQQ